MNRTVVVVVPGRIETRTGGYEYDRRIAAGLRALGWSVDIRELAGDFPCPSAGALAGAAGVLAELPVRTLAVIDGLALGTMPELIERESNRLRIVALVHLPLAARIGLEPAAAARVREAESRALRASATVVVTGRSTIAAIEQYGVDDRRIALVEPGTDPAPAARGSGQGPLQLLCVATLNRGKGHAILFRALESVGLDWRLTCAGSLTRDAATVQQLRRQLRSDRLDGRVTLTGEVDADRLAVLYDTADLFVLPTLHETYGMAVAEALAHGLPVVSTRTGAIPDLVGREAGIVVEPGDEQAFAGALRSVMSDPGLRHRLTDGARRVRARLPAWSDAAKKMNDVLIAVAGP